jgi:hypothetical protein
VSSGPYMCSIKQVSEADLGIPLQSGGRTLRCRKYSGDATETFLLAETSTGGQQVYQVFHNLRYFQTDH